MQIPDVMSMKSCQCLKYIVRSKDSFLPISRFLGRNPKEMGRQIRERERGTPISARGAAAICFRFGGSVTVSLSAAFLVAHLEEYFATMPLKRNSTPQKYHKKCGRIWTWQQNPYAPKRLQNEEVRIPTTTLPTGGTK